MTRWMRSSMIAKDTLTNGCNGASLAFNVSTSYWLPWKRNVWDTAWDLSSVTLTRRRFRSFVDLFNHDDLPDNVTGVEAERWCRARDISPRYTISHPRDKSNLGKTMLFSHRKGFDCPSWLNNIVVTLFEHFIDQTNVSRVFIWKTSPVLSLIKCGASYLSFPSFLAKHRHRRHDWLRLGRRHHVEHELNSCGHEF